MKCPQCTAIDLAICSISIEGNVSGASTPRNAVEAGQPFRPQENDEQGAAGASAGLEAESDAAEIARLLPPRRWSLDIFERNPWLRCAEFRIREAAKRTKFPFRALRYWFMYHLIRHEYQRRRRALAICEVGVDAGQMKVFMGPDWRGPERVRRWDAVDAAPDRTFLRSLGYGAILQQDVEARAFSLARKYDVIIFLHTAEHLFDPEPVFAKLAGRLTEGAILIGGSPVTPHWLAGYWERRLRRRARPLGHVSAISPRRIEAIAAANGLALDLLTGAFFLRCSGSRLENRRWWVRLNLAFGAAAPGAAGEIYWAMRLAANRGG